MNELVTDKETPVTAAQTQAAPRAANAPVAAAPPPTAPAASASLRPVSVEKTSTAVAARRIQGAVSRIGAEFGYRIARIGSLGVVGLLLIAGAIATFVMVNLPQRASVDALRAAVVQPGAPAGAGLAAAQVGKLITGLPPRSSAPEIIEKIVAQAKSAGVELDKGQYEFISERDGVAAHYRASFPVKTSYPQLRSFIDKTLLALPGVGVEGLRIERKAIGDETVEADLKLAIYVQDGT